MAQHLFHCTYQSLVQAFGRIASIKVSVDVENHTHIHRRSVPMTARGPKS
jgi:hypothetical protein